MLFFFLFLCQIQLAGHHLMSKINYNKLSVFLGGMFSWFFLGVVGIFGNALLNCSVCLTNAANRLVHHAICRDYSFHTIRSHNL